MSRQEIMIRNIIERSRLNGNYEEITDEGIQSGVDIISYLNTSILNQDIVGGALSVNTTALSNLTTDLDNSYALNAMNFSDLSKDDKDEINRYLRAIESAKVDLEKNIESVRDMLLKSIRTRPKSGVPKYATIPLDIYMERMVPVEAIKPKTTKMVNLVKRRLSDKEFKATLTTR